MRKDEIKIRMDEIIDYAQYPAFISRLKREPAYKGFAMSALNEADRLMRVEMYRMIKDLSQLVKDSGGDSGEEQSG